MPPTTTTTSTKTEEIISHIPTARDGGGPASVEFVSVFKTGSTTFGGAGEWRPASVVGVILGGTTVVPRTGFALAAVCRGGDLCVIGEDFETGSLFVDTSFARTEGALVTRGGARFSTDGGTDFAAEAAGVFFSAAGTASVVLRDLRGAFGAARGTSDFTDAKRRKTRG